MLIIIFILYIINNKHIYCDDFLSEAIEDRPEDSAGNDVNKKKLICTGRRTAVEYCCWLYFFSLVM